MKMDGSVMPEKNTAMHFLMHGGVFVFKTRVLLSGLPHEFFTDSIVVKV